MDKIVAELDLKSDRLNTAYLTNKSLMSENYKLKYQLRHLENVINTTKEKANNYSLTIIGALESVFDLAIRKAYPSINDHNVLLNPCGNPKFGDYQCNSPMGISKTLSLQGILTNPIEIGKTIVANLIECGAIDKCEVAGQGFINIFLKREFVAQEICKIINHGVLPPKYLRERIILDFSSPNIAKEMHVGHLRSTIIGDCLARLFRFMQCDVMAVNHIGDWGTQFGMLIAHLQDKFPNYITECPPIADLQAFYKESKKRFDEEPEFKDRAYKAVVQLQNHEEEFLKAWNLICDVSRCEFKKIYKRLDVEGLFERGESFYQDKMESLIDELEARGVLTEHDGTKRLTSDNETYMLMVKSDGGYTYDTSDMAALKYRLVDERAERVVYVVDSGQSSHFEGLFAAAKKVGFYDDRKQRVEHVGFGVVLGADKKKFKSRANETVRLADLLDEGISRSLAKLKEKGRDTELTPEELEAAQKSVAYGCIKYADLSHHRIKEYIFSFDKMLQDKGNTAVYLLYAYTRISGISRTAKVSIDDMQQYLLLNPLKFDHDKEWKLAKCITRFPEVLLKLTVDLLPHSLCDYLYDLCCTFTEFYEACYCVQKDPKTGQIITINQWRVVLAEATAQVLKTGFTILGLTPVQKM